ncbi:MAG TPA: hypothetical protein VNZ47_01575 [Candidatus Dormibacteraeota bacterium]|nr:hypothetical protein [Candidatus Dormibacteraeota bacterium]
MITTRYFLPIPKGKAMRAERTLSVAQPGEIWIFSRSSVPLELLSGKSTMLEQFRGDATLKKFRSSQNSGFAEQDYLALFGRILKASESGQARNSMASAPLLPLPTGSLRSRRKMVSIGAW